MNSFGYVRHGPSYARRHSTPNVVRLSPLHFQTPQRALTKTVRDLIAVHVFDALKNLVGSNDPQPSLEAEDDSAEQGYEDFSSLYQQGSCVPLEPLNHLNLTVPSVVPGPHALHPDKRITMWGAHAYFYDWPYLLLFLLLQDASPGLWIFPR